MNTRLDAAKYMGLGAAKALFALQKEVDSSSLERSLESELVVLTFAVIAINAWNRLAVAFRFPAGTYQPGQLVAS